MFLFTIGSLFLTIVSAERALPDYTMDVGEQPAWLTDSDKAAAAMDRWYIDQADATCKEFKYLGSLGNFNNFVSRSACETHLKFTPEEKADSCALAKADGACTLPDDRKIDRWHFKLADVSASNNGCTKFKYNGCGGNANNFDTEDECKNYCHNNKNGKVVEATFTSSLTATPNKVDCDFVPAIKTDSPKMGIIPKGNKCVYAAVGKEATRGFFDDLPTCVKTCISTDHQVAACKSEGPYQTPSATELTTVDASVKTYHYFNKEKKICLPFMSIAPPEAVKVDDGENNIFSSVEMCASFCPATGHLGPLKAVEACKLPKLGEWGTGDEGKYKLARYYYDFTDTGNTEKCKSFNFNGKEMNLNNFSTITDCQAICKNPLTGSPS